MKIYTKGGDAGQTQVYVDKAIRLSKDDALLECYGSLDELNAHMGLLRSMLPESDSNAEADGITQVQRKLFVIGFVISAHGKVVEEDLTALEAQIDTWQEELVPQRHFILPGGCPPAAQAHVCRTVARRAERVMVALSHQHDVPPLCLKYLNRLSDWLFVLARRLNQMAKVADQVL
ncbi:cob(I)yrinic acid a,c-diamide adenosyltransferase [Aliiglaciecola sp. CAU 1673]|uniref:cob(I)yrinic acid a,c-diamide adenosyltransferase n=1 Tax=Aliiglaciecola sp. CAU 1673 TaxID=3032595 RepID=UPI0023DBC712|nr:cob(I)yrinic acid a,c-diamide adenosyltransferase [Aliiglaciecola sp. CAU 1673]MDF2178842.1 cob(I)yrinic acid a,c-diamide adenosyltransferase [Aliiglaciecola sp. CAU 1673]